MMRKLLPVVMLLLSCGGGLTPLHAAPHWLTAVPRAVGRSYGNMFTFKQPWVAVQQWAQVGSVILDEKTTQDVFARCATCFETSPLVHGLRYGTLGAIGSGILSTTVETTYTKYLSEIDDIDTSKTWRNLYSGFPALTIALHTHAAMGNIGLK